MRLTLRPTPPELTVAANPKNLCNRHKFGVIRRLLGLQTLWVSTCFMGSPSRFLPWTHAANQTDISQFKAALMVCRAKTLTVIFLGLSTIQIVVSHLRCLDAGRVLANRTSGSLCCASEK